MWQESEKLDAEEFFKPVETSLPSITEFYQDKTILVTGGLGFVGQNFIEKLLWECPQVKCIYLLIRDKQNKTSQERLNRLLQDDTFKRIRNRDDSYKQKILAISGDLFHEDLGLSLHDRNKIISEVDIVVHCAANVRFDEPLTNAINSNIKASKYILELALEICHLIVFTYVSTAYTNCHLSYADEKLYKPLADWRETIQFSERIDPKVFNTLAIKYNNRMPNTYVFTKHLAEHMAYEYGEKLPLVITRPAIVCSAYLEPEPGWCANIIGSPGLLLGIMAGVIRIALGKKDRLQTDFIPCDKVTCAIIQATYLRPFQRNKLKPIYNIACSNEHDVDMKRFQKQGLKAVRNSPTKFSIWKPRVTITDNQYVFYFNFILLQLIPALLIDFLMKLFGRKPMLYSVQKIYYRQVLATCYFTLRSFDFNNKNSHFANKYLQEKDRQLFKFVYSQQEINDLINSGEVMQGAPMFLRKKYLMHQSPKDDQIAFRIVKVQNILDIIVRYGFYLYILWYILSNNIIGNFINKTKFIFNFYKFSY